ncbi:FCD domain-containing protein [Saccharomonospora sp. CUA-673]|uniref:FCD domain-containing protein n=1 Tax=Saccharomonospora sp. CUA-673 TaxID=1904969 RepID=UPI002101944E|nr:FCD domain-containing protein [Saccharomonospora sp. CUA-673]
MQRATLDPWRAHDYTASNVDFHEDIVHLSGNEFVVGQLPILRMTAQVFAPVALVEPDTARRAIEQHTAITDAIAAGDGPDAERLARAHIDATITELRARKARSSPASATKE